MKFWVGVTDNRWFNYVATRNLDEVNFWQPSATPPFKEAPIGLPFLFKLKKPNNHIAGGGYFVTYSTLPISLAWEIFGEKNGAASVNDFYAMLEPFNDGKSITKEIGCTVLANPFFLPHEQWIADPAGWSANIVRGKMYESDLTEGASIWGELKERQLISRVQASDGSIVSTHFANQSAEKYGNPTLVKPRIGQASFRVLVTDAYKRRCAITGENTLVALEAAHIVPYSKDGSHEIQNGLLLRADFHRLFDAGLISVTQDLQIKISPKIRETWFNGKVYYRLNDQRLSVLPDSPTQWPDRDRLAWHFKNCFQA